MRLVIKMDAKRLGVLLEQMYTRVLPQFPISTMIHGKAGIGKSDIVRQTAERLGIGYIDLRLAEMETGDLIGLPFQKLVFATDEVAVYVESLAAKGISTLELLLSLVQHKFGPGAINVQTSWGRPQWFPRDDWPAPPTPPPPPPGHGGENELRALKNVVGHIANGHYGPKGILCLEEINRAHRDTRQAVFQLVWDRKLNTHKLPSGWMIASCVNPVAEGYIVDELDEAFIGRFLHIKFSPMKSDWLTWAASQGWDSSTVGLSFMNFIGKYPNMLGNDPIDIPLQIKPSPRSNAMAKVLVENLDSELHFEVLCGVIGPEAATAYQALCKEGDSPVQPTDILNHYKKVRSTILRYANSKEAKGARMDLLFVTTDNLVAALTSWDAKDMKLTGEQHRNLKQFLKDVPDDFAFAIIKRLVKLNVYEQLKADEELFDMVSRASDGVQDA